MKTLYKEVENLIDSSEYDKACELVKDKFNIEMNVEFLRNGKYFDGDKVSRGIYKITLKRGSREFSFNFGQSIANMGKAPDLYDVLPCLTKYDPETFEDFCEEFGYNLESKLHKEIYKAFQKEYYNMAKMFNGEELEILSCIR